MFTTRKDNQVFDKEMFLDTLQDELEMSSEEELTATHAADFWNGFSSGLRLAKKRFNQAMKETA